MMNKDSH